MHVPGTTRLVHAAWAMNTMAWGLSLAKLRCGLGAFIFLYAASARAEPVRVEVGTVEGPSYSRVRAAVQIALKQRPEVQVVRKAHDAIIKGKVTQLQGGTLQVRLDLYDKVRAIRGSALFEGREPKALALDIKSRLWTQFGSTLSRGRDHFRGPRLRRTRKKRVRSPSPSPSPSLKPVESKPLDSAPSIRQGAGFQPLRSTPGSDIFRFGVGVGLFSRSLSWNDNVLQDLAEYSLGSAPAFRGDVAWFPGAHFTNGPLSWVGLDIEAELPFAVESNRDGVIFPTAASAWRVGLLGRVPMRNFEGQIGIGFSERRFDLERSDTGEEVADLPRVRYQNLSARAAILGRFFSRLDAAIRLGWGFMLDAGEIGRAGWFPNGSSHMAEAGVSSTLYLVSGLGIFARFDWHGAFFSFEPEVGDLRVAGGASDNYFMGTLGVSFSASGP